MHRAFQLDAQASAICPADKCTSYPRRSTLCGHPVMCEKHARLEGASLGGNAVMCGSVNAFQQIVDVYSLRLVRCFEYTGDAGIARIGPKLQSAIWLNADQGAANAAVKSMDSFMAAFQSGSSSSGPRKAPSEAGIVRDDEYGWKVLRTGVESGHELITRWLMERNTDVDVKDSNLMELYQASEEGRFMVNRWLKKNQANGAHFAH